VIEGVMIYLNMTFLTYNLLDITDFLKLSFSHLLWGRSQTTPPMMVLSEGCATRMWDVVNGVLGDQCA
jgi:hypothetical protein